MFDVVTVGGVVRDICFVTNVGRILKTPHDILAQEKVCFEFGTKFESDNVFFSVGGGAANTAVGLSRLGKKAALFSFFGNDARRKAIFGILKKEKVDLSLAKTIPGLTGLSFALIDEPSTEHVVFLYRGVNDQLMVNNKLKKALKKSRWVHLTSLGGEWKKTIKDLTKNLGKTNLSWNPGGAQIKKGIKTLMPLLKKTFILFVNQDEALELVLGVKSKTKVNVEDTSVLLETLRSFGPRVVIITSGKKGAYVSDHEKILFAPAVSKNEKDTLGAGDAFCSGFLGGYMENEDIERGLRFGILNSASVVEDYTAQKGLLTKRQILARLKKVRIKEIGK